MLGRTSAETRKQRTLHSCLKHFAFKFEIDRSFPKNHPTCATRSKPCSTCCTDFAPTGSVHCPKLPSPCRFVRFHRLCRLQTSKFRLQPEVLLKWAEPHCTQEAGPICARFSFGANHRLAIVVLLGLARNFFFFTCFFSSVPFFWQGLFVVIHPRTCPRVFFAFHVLVQLVALLSSVENLFASFGLSAFAVGPCGF